MKPFFPIPTPAVTDSHLAEVLTGIWERSVRQTHLFLAETDIKSLKNDVRRMIGALGQIYTASGPDGSVKAFMAVKGDKLEMLFADPSVFGRGYGKSLALYGIRRLGAKRVDVNVQNPKAVKFYEKFGFEITGGSEEDSEGRPFPLAFMELREQSDEKPPGSGRP